VVDTPPPTVSGSLHIGHCFSYTHTDLVVRWHRMRGDNIFYPMGWDDNGLPTERRVQNVFNVRCDPSMAYDPDLTLEFGRAGNTMPVARQNFIELCARVAQEDERRFKELWQRLGLSVDWNETYATIDRRSRYVSQLSFLRLVEKGEAELREAPTMWDVDFQTAVAQAEIEDRDKDGLFYRIRFGVEEGDDVVIATTRPELLPACIAVAAHPDDARYRHLIGRRAVTPLFHAPVPIIPDEGADPSKGTGILMVCTFGDAADVELWRTLRVPAREVIGRDGHIKVAPWGERHWVSLDADAARRNHDKLMGLSVSRARKEIASMLSESQMLDGEPETIRRPVKFYERGERPLEFIVTRQWFVKVLDRKKELVDQGRKIAWHPETMRKRYEDWVEGLNQDWCTSRQRYFGVPIPLWYGITADGSVDHSEMLFPRIEDLPVDPSTDAPPGYLEDQRAKPGGFIGDPDVFDTWATSSLTPLIASGWPDDQARHAALYPNDLRPQAHEIIRTWAFYTITRSFLEDGLIPWKHIAISGFVVDPDRKKMSKSKGNVVLPTDALDAYGSDAVRYWAGSGRLGVDARFDPKVLKEGKRLTTKIVNASRLVLGYEGGGGPATAPLDRALIARLRSVVEDVSARWERWDHAGALGETEAWFWSEFCDNYLELSKTRAYRGDPSALGVLRQALDVVLRLFAPFLPYVTEEVWNWDRATPESIHRARWPEPSELDHGDDEGCFDAAVTVMTQIRRAKSEAKTSMKAPVDNLVVRGAPDALDLLRSVMDDVVATGNVRRHELVADDSLEQLSAAVEVGDPEPASRR
jgi:valyl-tRNA synthetase